MKILHIIGRTTVVVIILLIAFIHDCFHGILSKNAIGVGLSKCNYYIKNGYWESEDKDEEEY